MSSILKYTWLAGDLEVGRSKRDQERPAPEESQGREARSREEDAADVAAAKAWQAGWQAGREEGLREARAEVEHLRGEAETLLREAEAARTAWWREAEEQLAELAVELARRILRRELYLEPEAVVRLARELLVESGARTRVRLRVNPADAGLVEGERPSLEAALGGGLALEIRSDAEVGAGGVVIESDAGGLDGRIETQLARLESVLREVAGGARA